jgi:hypothetical protein
VPIDLAFDLGMAVARGICIALGSSPCLACGRFRNRGRLEFGFGDLQHLPLGGRVEARPLQFVLDIDETGPLGKPPRSAGWRVRGRHETVPAPDIAFARYQPLAGFQF